MQALREEAKKLRLEDAFARAGSSRTSESQDGPKQFSRRKGSRTQSSREAVKNQV